MPVDVAADLHPTLLSILDGGSDVAVLKMSIVDDQLVEHLKVTMADCPGLKTFDRCRKAVECSKAAIVLCRVDEKSNSPKWVQVLWVPPETSAVQRVLHGAVHAQLFDFLISSADVTDRVASTLDELGEKCSLRDEYAASASSTRRPSSNASCEDSLEFAGPISPSVGKHRELSVSARRRSKKRGSGRSGGQRASLVTIEETASFQDAIASFKSRQNDCVELELHDAASYCTATVVDFNTLRQLGEKLHMREPRFYLVRHEGRVFYFLFSPEAATRKLRLLYAATKRWVLVLLREKDFPIDGFFDLRTASELPHLVTSLLDPLKEKNDEGGHATDLTALGQLSLSVSRPSPPGITG